jgi:hypothetical protein
LVQVGIREREREQQDEDDTMITGVHDKSNTHAISNRVAKSMANSYMAMN